MQRTAVLVLGMHRSGTSAFTRVISLLGANLPQELMHAVPDNNEAGFWESLDVYRLNDEILASAGSSWDDWRRFNADWFRSPAKQQMKTRALEILEKDFASSTLFVMKDPRICRLLPFWLEVLSEFDTETKCVLPIRNPLEVAASLKQRDGFGPAKSHVLWLRHVLDAEAGSRGLKRGFVSYDNLLNDWRRAVSELSGAIDVAWPRQSATSEVEIDTFLERRHRHHSESQHLVFDHPELADWVKDTYAGLLTLETEPGSEDALHRLDKVRSDFDRASVVFGTVLRSEEMAREELAAESSERIGELEQIAAQREAGIEELKHVAGLRLELIGELKQTAARREARIGELEQIAARREAGIEELKQTAARREARIGELEQIAARREAGLKELNQVAERRLKLIGELEQIVARRGTGIKELEEVAERRLQRIGELEQIAAQRETGIKQLQEAAARGQAQLEATQQQKRKALKLKAKLLRRLDKVQTTASWQLASPLLAIESRWPRSVRGLTAVPKLAWWTLTLQLPQRIRFRKLANKLVQTGLFDREWYIERYPDIVLKGLNPVVHWLATGWTQHRDPNPCFDTDWYLAQYPDVVESGINPLVHYVERGAASNRDPSPLFDTKWYVSQHPDVASTGVNPIAHYLKKGRAKGWTCRPPLDQDEPPGNSSEQADQGDLRGNPHGEPNQAGGPGNWRQEARQNDGPSGFSDRFPPLYMQMLANAQRLPAQSDYIPETALNVDASSLPIRLIAFYLPQFHPIPENDAWWGKGFTEWTNVTKAVPQFQGHYQPRLPDALGYYDLRLKEVQREQIRLAKKYGFYGFCYHHYWFGGKRLLERPFQQVLDDPSLDFPFCICWANENWTRRWDGHDDEVLIGQNHSPEDDIAFIADLEPALRDPRYIRVEGRPLLIVYRAHLLPDPHATADRWRQFCRDRGLPEVYLVAAQTFGHKDPAEVGFDAAVAFPPHHNPGVIAPVEFYNPEFQGKAFDLPALVSKAESGYEDGSSFDFFPTVMPSWDNEARRPGQGRVFVGASPALYGRWLSSACSAAMGAQAPDKRIVFVNAWNEWAEGAYLEPDRRYGFAYLQATAKVLSSLPRTSDKDRRSTQPLTAQRQAQLRLLIVGHDAFPAGAQLNLLHLIRLLRQRFGVEVAAWLLEGGELLEDYQAACDVAVVGDDVGEWARLARRLRSEGFGVALINTVVTGAVAPVLREAGFSVVSLVHEMPQLIRDRHLEPEAMAIAKNASRVVFAADAVRRAYAEVAYVPTTNAVLLPQGIYQVLKAPAAARAEVEAELELPQNATLVLNAGYGDRRKGFDIFLDCATALGKQYPTFHFLWLGNIAPDLQEDFERARGVMTNLRHIPFTKSPGRYFAAADALMLTSREDPFPSVVLEALAFGLPVVAFEGSGGHCELLEDPLYGRLAAPLGDPAALAEQLRRAVSADAKEEGRRAERAEAARTAFDFANYGWELLRLFQPTLMRVSVVVPNYNYAHYLKDRLESIFAQTYPVFEVIVLDDASTDDSVTVIRRTSEASGREIRLVESRNNSGSPFAQWAKGIRLAAGDLVWIAEADDLADPQFLQRLVERLAADDEMVFAFSNSYQIGRDGELSGRCYADYCNASSELDFGSDFTAASGQFLRSALAVKNSILNVSSAVFRRSRLLDALAGAEDELQSWRIAGDWRLYIELCQADGRVAYIADPLNLHRRHDESIVGSNQLDAHIAEISRMHALLRRLLPAGDLPLRDQTSYVSELMERAQGSPQDDGPSAGNDGERAGAANADSGPNLRSLDDSAWFETVCASLEARYVAGLLMPGFPSVELQRSTVGNSGRDALSEAFQFYKLVRSYAASHLVTPLSEARVLDFGCGWGRHLRFFLRDCSPSNLWGSDVDGEFVALCKAMFDGIGCQFLANDPTPPLAVDDHQFDLVYSFSVFSHLSPEVNLAWAAELVRITRPGALAVVTTQRRAFLDYCEAIKQGEPKSSWHETLAKAFSDIEADKRRYDNGEAVYVPSGGGGVREGWFYGEAVIPHSFFVEHWPDELEIIDFIDDAQRCPQAVVVARRRG
jgi:glycosyltransferase involved in cell wall biosynthesis/2-polyprenyl-3-methyl-5-hydroxy-6-metoxy-1,4-benzoquinol methylase